MSLPTALLREAAGTPGHFWIRHAPARWPAPPLPWLDLSTGELGRGGGPAETLAALERSPLDDLLYLPPVPAAVVEARDRLAARHAARGTPVLVQVLPGDPLPAPVEGVVVVWDLLPLALEPRGQLAARVTASLHRGGDAAAWPLAAGLGEEEAFDELAAAVAGAGVPVLQGVMLELSGRDRRSLGAALGEERYLRLFHGDPPAVGSLARAAARGGLLPLLPRRLPRPPLRGAGNLRVAAALATVAELCVLLGEPESRVQSLLRAARFSEKATQDLAALAREGNLAVLPWLEGEAREVAEATAAGEQARLWQQLLARLAAT